MTLTRKDGGAALLTALVVLVFAASHEAWRVPLVGGSQRWAAAAILVLGTATCALGSPEGRGVIVLSLLGVTALVLAVLAMATGSLAALSLLTADIVVLFAAATLRHAVHAGHSPLHA